MVRRALLPCLLLLVVPAAVRAQQAPAAPQTPTWQFHARNTTRMESWDFFQPKPGGGNPRYTFPANRLYGYVDVRSRHVDATAGVQYVQFGNLPSNATGPGPLGTGPQYYDQGGSRTNSNQVYVRILNARIKNLAPGLTLQAGRFGFASGAESASGDAAIEAVKRMRLDSRLIGEFEWSLYQRSFDGVRGDVDRKPWHATGAWMWPTQGGFEDQAGKTLRHVDIGTASVSLKPGTIARHTDVQGFVTHYADTRAVTARPDNSGLTATAADVHVTSFGASAVGVYPVAHGQIDTLVWVVWQTGDWYGLSHRANAIATEAGYQWPKAHGRPWVRGGWFHSSGDGNATDARHETFFQVMPTARKYSLSTAYNLMNLEDAFLQAVVKPSARLTLRGDLHWLGLSNAADLWYAGSGATQRAGSVFGYAGRRSNGSTDLGTMAEAAADWAMSPHFSLNGYFGHMDGGAVVTGTFAGSTLQFGYVETVISF